MDDKKPIEQRTGKSTPHQVSDEAIEGYSKKFKRISEKPKETDTEQYKPTKPVKKQKVPEPLSISSDEEVPLTKPKKVVKKVTK